MTGESLKEGSSPPLKLTHCTQAGTALPAERMGVELAEPAEAAAHSALEKQV